MESETLFVEEAEPPGRLTGIVGPTQHHDFNTSLSTLCTPVAVPTTRSVFKPVPLNDSRSRAFRKRFFPNATPKEWQDWHWQLRNRIRDVETLGAMLRLSEDERHAMSGQASSLPLAITPYYASLLDPWNPKQALRRTVVPTVHEQFRSSGEADDPLHEEQDSPVPGIVHRYPDRLLFLVTGNCSTYCRYCTRSRMVGHQGNHCLNTDQWERGLAYIAAHPEVRDVLLSGGDPLTLADEQLEWLLLRLRQIPHVQLIRIGTKVPIVLPQRITPALVKMLKRYHPLWISIHAAHPDELTAETARACTRLADAGIPLGSQTVLLAGINDDVETMRRLVQGLLMIRVKPYYLYQCDPIPGSSHFRTPVAKGLEIIRGLRGFTTGYAVPTYVIDAPGGGGKIPLLPEYAEGREDGDLLLRNYEGRVFRYPDAPARESVIH
ncbi:MAG: KamA family radical SAM protein [Deltaproteobacteria bacterium]|nr:KamA family radical SAM protein [Deltaproteobacteria bacterium]